MKPIVFTREETRDMARRLQDWFAAELDQELSALQAEMLIAHMSRDLGAAFYNRGLYDAQALFAAKADETVEALYGLERKPGGR